MDIIDQLTTLLNSATPLTLSDPLFKELETRYPMKFRFAVGMIAGNSLEDIIEWIKATGGPLYVSMLDGPASGPYLKQRLGELRALIVERKNAIKQPKQNVNAQPKETSIPPQTEA